MAHTLTPTPDVVVAEAVELCSRLIRFDTSNFGGGNARGERAAAEWVAERLSDAGYLPEIFEAAPGRASTVARIPGVDRLAPALVVHGHLDVVPAEAADWSVDPFGGEVRDGAVWGRGALDMKDMDAMMLAVVRAWAREEFVPPRDIVLAFVADEEDRGDLGAGFLVAEHPDLFEGVRTAIGESGGHSVHLPDGTRLYPVATAERGSAWIDLTAVGPAGHGSLHHPANAVARLARAVARLADHEWPPHLVPPTSVLLDGLSAHLGVTIDPNDPASLAQLGEAATLVTSTTANSVNPTMLSAGYKHNVVPGSATAGIDGRILPGTEEEFFEALDTLIGEGVSRAFVNFSPPVAAGDEQGEYAAMADALRAHDPAALVLPYCMAGGTDAKAFARLGIDCYGFVPGRTPPGFPSDSYVHGVDERVLVDSLAFGVGVLDTYLRTAPAPAPLDQSRNQQSRTHQRRDRP
ncbi:M20/M25/M40 family metallo-hydrolase [Lapillicoccus sp.]|uniref:M20/M25/M40 family metallo-hydrolase n=1 Tax=Lapillicoccus sp. TaxID=1909287 RepID=UPI0025FE7349|nr:M20/M25/M40 family metallo-hydrolase [Lapillicoccus sp.]